MTDSLTAPLLPPSFTAELSSSVRALGSKGRLGRRQGETLADTASSPLTEQDPQR
ncbi:hypothetical protein LL972_07435 [Xanthomonas campestris pv. asclepiadis]|uniref:hypothetical protein n=1 Tax=Xanthomonas campestris TaxID=339 RepID=UPI001E62A52C|nr:hypothetical protein [Xanthomonas campestris]MCC4615838.1 hypothetical protein [Xanthomonas campestris pv. asclepiadis]